LKWNAFSPGHLTGWLVRAHSRFRMRTSAEARARRVLPHTLTWGSYALHERADEGAQAGDLRAHHVWAMLAVSVMTCSRGIQLNNLRLRDIQPLDRADREKDLNITLVFCKLDTTGRARPGTIWGRKAAEEDLKARIVQATGSPVAGITMHSPRHTGRTLLGRARVRPETVSPGYDPCEDDPDVVLRCTAPLFSGSPTDADSIFRRAEASGGRKDLDVVDDGVRRKLGRSGEWRRRRPDYSLVSEFQLVCCPGETPRVAQQLLFAGSPQQLLFAGSPTDAVWLVCPGAAHFAPAP
jgi:hypothetical protein